MNGAISTRPPLEAPLIPWKFAATLLLALLFAILFGWTAKSLLDMQPVPLVPCKRCAEKCPCPRMSGAIRCGCPE